MTPLNFSQFISRKFSFVRLPQSVRLRTTGFALLVALMGLPSVSVHAGILDGIFGGLFKDSSYPRCDTQNLSRELSDVKGLHQEAQRLLEKKKYCEAARKFFEVELQDARYGNKVNAAMSGIKALAAEGALEDLLFEVENYRLFHPTGAKMAQADLIKIQTFAAFLPSDPCQSPIGIGERKKNIPYELGEQVELFIKNYRKLHGEQSSQEITTIEKKLKEYIAGKQVCVVKEHVWKKAEETRSPGRWQAIYQRLMIVIRDYQETKVITEAMYMATVAAKSVSDTIANDVDVPASDRERLSEGWKERGRNMVDLMRQYFPKDSYTQKALRVDLQ